jgi:PAS domain S-box-containing protein
MRDRRSDPNSARPHKRSSKPHARNSRHKSPTIEAVVTNEEPLAIVGSWSWDIITGQMVWSDELYRILGLYPQEIEASFEAGMARIHPEERETVLLALEKCMYRGERYGQPIRIIRPDGEIRLLQVLGSVVTDEQRIPVRMFGICHDITEMEATKEARRDAERKYRQIFENAGEGIFQSTPEGCYLTANPALALMHGFDSPEELIRSRRDISHEIYVDPACREEFKRRLEKYGIVRAFEHQTFRKDGSKIWISVNARAVKDEAGRVLYYEGTALDITERKQAEQALRESEERYRELFENSKDALYVHDMGGRYTSVNRAAETLSGYTREELIGEHFSAFVDPKYQAQVQGKLLSKLEDAAETTYEIEIITKQGSHVPVEISSRLIFENGAPVGVQGCVRDISERKRAQAASRTYSRRLLEAQEAERRRISRELHDQVGQILTAVKMNLHSLQQKCSTPEILSSIGDNMEVIDEAVDQVRDLSVDLRPLLLDDFGLAVALRWYLDRQAKSFGVPAAFIKRSLREYDRFSSELETACFRIVQEAVTNVVRHAGASRITVTLERTDSELTLLISDDGAGFDTGVLRSGVPTLGLRGMEERVQALGGSITIDSGPARGTEICARFPLQEAALRVASKAHHG